MRFAGMPVRFAVALLGLLTILACKKVVRVDLVDVTPRIVIEGNITDGPGPYQVLLSQTVNFSANNTFPPVTGATVTITDSNSGKAEQLIEVDSGVYLSLALMGLPSHTYQLVVVAAGQQYTASSKMPLPVRLDSVTLEANVTLNNQREINAVVNFQDPPGITNYYQFTEAVDGRVIPDIFVFDDRLSDGRYIQEPLFNDSSYLQVGDTLQVTMNCVDQNTYNYFYSLANVVGGNGLQSATPANPTSNISNGALGYFSAHTTTVDKLLIY
jgi:Domain of unknown function (DUF4249)